MVTPQIQELLEELEAMVVLQWAEDLVATEEVVEIRAQDMLEGTVQQVARAEAVVPGDQQTEVLFTIQTAS